MKGMAISENAEVTALAFKQYNVIYLNSGTIQMAKWIQSSHCEVNWKFSRCKIPFKLTQQLCGGIALTHFVSIFHMEKNKRKGESIS
jgi:hypothetical protein